MKKVRRGRKRGRRGGGVGEGGRGSGRDQDEDQGHPTRVRKSKGCQDSGNTRRN